MDPDALLALALAGVGTYLIRYLPLRHAGWLGTASTHVTRFMALKPAAAA